MPTIMKLRPLQADEREQREQLSRSPTAPAREVERARILLYASENWHVPRIFAHLHLNDY